MKKYIKQGVAALAAVTLIGSSLYGTKKLFEGKASMEKYEDFFESDTDFDVLFFGSSRVYDSIFPLELWNEYGITSYNCAYNSGTLVQSYYLVQETLQYTSPKMVVVDLMGMLSWEWKDDTNGKYRPNRIEQQHVQFDRFPLTRSKIAAVKDIFDNYENNDDFLEDFLMYHSRWDDLTENDFRPYISPLKGAEFFVTYSEIENEPLDPSLYYNEEKFTGTVAYGYLLKLIEYCEENNIPLLFTYSPAPIYASRQKLGHTLEKFFSEHPSCKYVNILDLLIADPKTDFAGDADHLNYLGGRKLTSWIGSYIQDNYELTDHRSDPEYADWNEDYAAYLDYRTGIIQEQTDYYSVIIAASGEDYVTEITLTPNAQSSEVLNCFCSNALDPDQDSATVSDTVSFRDKPCDLLIRVSRASTGDICLERAYTCKNGKFSLVKD